MNEFYPMQCKPSPQCSYNWWHHFLGGFYGTYGGINKTTRASRVVIVVVVVVVIVVVDLKDD